MHEYSVSDYAFWEDLWQFLAIIYSAPPTKVCVPVTVVPADAHLFVPQIMTTGHIKEVPVWFPGARLNYAENLLWRNDDAIALTATGELGQVTSCSFRQLRSLVQGMAGAMKAKGLQVGDRVAGEQHPRALNLPRYPAATSHIEDLFSGSMSSRVVF